MTNLVVEIPGTLPGIIVIGNHYDTKFFADFNFVGANDGGSTTAWMIEFARAIGPQREGRTVWLCWFDGEEAFLEWSDMDSLYGSREMVSRLQADDRLGEVQAMINLDMIGDCQLSVFHDAGAPEWLVETIAGAARETGNSGAFIPRTTSTEDDHVSFRKAGVPAINLIDFYYGGGSAEHHMNWHTSRDRIDLVCAESLQAIGEVMLAALPRLDRAPMDRGRGE
jgi:Zn-dependent M28 family amino/carboxypeptidase